MIAAEDDLRAWIGQHFYGTTLTDDVVVMDTELLIEYMRDRGWYWERIPDEASHA